MIDVAVLGSTGSIGTQTLEVIATDPAAPTDFEAFCRQTGNVLVESGKTDDGKFLLVLKRK